MIERDDSYAAYRRDMVTLSRDTPIDSILPWIVKIAATLVAEERVYGVDFSDLVQAGNLGAILAMESWDPEKGALTTWVSFRARREMMREGRRGGRIPRSVPYGELTYPPEDEDDEDFVAGSDYVGSQSPEQELQAEQESIFNLAEGILVGRDLEVILRLYEQGQTHNEVAAIWGVSRQRITEIRRRAIKRLRQGVAESRSTGIFTIGDSV